MERGPENMGGDLERDGAPRPARGGARQALALLAGAALGIAALIAADQHTAAARAPGLDELAPPLVVGAADGRSAIDLEKLRGRAVAVNFWAPWCGPCQAELPDLAAVKRELADRCVELIGVAGAGGREEVAQIASRQPYPMGFDADGTAMRAWRVEAVPTTYIVDPAGKIRAVIAGAVDKAQLLDALRPIVPGSCPGTGGLGIAGGPASN